MARFVVLINFTEKGIANIPASPDRAQAFRSDAESKGVKVETMLWMTGPYDGLLVLEAPDEHTATALTLSLCKSGNVSTSTLRAFDADEFKNVLGHMA